MKYFTPELYQQFNSFDQAEAERADDAWDAAGIAYKQRLESVRKRMPSQVAELAALCLHDAEVLSRIEQAQSAGAVQFSEFPYPFPFPMWSAVAIVSVVLDREIVSLIYSLIDHVATTQAPEGWRFSKLQEHWLYDEVDWLDNHRGPFVHRILLSTGITLEVPFVSAIIHRFAVPTAQGAAKRTA